jgi:hypothetical protein
LEGVVEITLTYTLPDFRPDVADFARRHNLPVVYGDYVVKTEEDDGYDHALLVSVGHDEMEARTDGASLVEELHTLIGDEEWDLYIGEEYWANFADRETLDSCLEQFGQKIRALFPDVRFEYAPFLE